MNVLIISGHTNLNDSVANKTIIEELRTAFPKAEFTILNELYPDFKIDVAAEQAKAEKADLIVFQFPVFWYSMPSLLRRWIENVFAYGFAYGSTGNKLAGTKLIPSFTTGAPEESYSKEGVGYSIHEIMDPQLKTMAALCQMDIKPSVISHGISYVTEQETIKSMAREHAAKLIEAIKKA